MTWNKSGSVSTGPGKCRRVNSFSKKNREIDASICFSVHYLSNVHSKLSNDYN